MLRFLSFIAALMVLAGLAGVSSASAHGVHAPVAPEMTSAAIADSAVPPAPLRIAAAAITRDCSDTCCDDCGCAGGARHCCAAPAALAPGLATGVAAAIGRPGRHARPGDTASRPGAAIAEIDHPPIFA